MNANTVCYNRIVIGMKHRLADDIPDGALVVYFTTDSDPAIGENKRSDSVKLIGHDSDNVNEYIVDFSENEQWKGIITGIRIDPFSGGGSFDID